MRTSRPGKARAAATAPGPDSSYRLPDEVYEDVVNQRVAAGCVWLDVGGGRAIFPRNLALARELVARCARVVAVDPSAQVLRNDTVHERVRSTLEDYGGTARFDLATMRMVVEHVRAPEPFLAAMARLVKPAGVVIVLTTNRRSPVSWLARLLPFRLHYPITRFFWGGEAGDTFPVHYRMNTRRDLLRLFEQAGFEELEFARLDDLSVFRRFKWLNYLELLLWRGLKRVGLGYPESCLLGVYRRSATISGLLES